MNTPPLNTHGSSARAFMVAITVQRAFGSLLLLLAIISVGCSSDTTGLDQKFELKINLKSEPDHLNPVLSKQLTSRQIERFLLCPLEDFNPMTLSLEPLLLVDRPNVEVVQEGSQQGKTRYDMQILPEAQWDDGSPVTGYDYLFTMKMGLVPYLSNTAWSSFMQVLDSIEVDPVDPKHLTVFVDEPYMMGEEIVCGFSVYPAHVYDSDSLLYGIAFRTMKDLNKAQIDSGLDQTLHAFADKFNSIAFSRELVQGCGPYRLVEWIANQQIVLEKKSDYWATNIKGKHPILEANPDRLIYYMMSDQQTAFTSLKDGKLDIMAELTPEQLNELSNDKEGRALRSYSPEVLQYYYIAYNTDHLILSDVRVRKALSHLLDIRAIIDKLFYGYAIPIIGPISPSKPYYHKGLAPIPFNIDSARALLTVAGWQDGDADGTLEKTIEGVVVPLKLQIFTSKSRISQDVAVLLQLHAKKVGIAVEIVPKNTNEYIGLVMKGNYDMAALAVVQSVGDSDPYNFWHSDNAYSEGSNLTKLRNQELDDLILELRSSIDGARRAELYLRMQEIIYDQHPALFLLAPKMSLAARADLQMAISIMRPGYFENLTTLH